MGVGQGQSAMFYDTIEAVVVETLQKKIIYPSLTTPVPSPQGNAFLWTSMSSISVDESTTGSSGDNVTLEFTRHILELTERKVVPKIYDNDVNDARWDAVALTTNEIARAFARAMNSDFATAVDSAVYTAATSPSATEHSVGAGAAWNSSDADILGDLKAALDTCYADDGEVDAIMMNPQDYTSMLMQPDFLRATAQGDRALLEGAIDKVFNMSIFTSTTLTRGTVYGLNSKDSVNFYEREPFTTEFARDAKARATDVVCYARYGFAVVRPEHVFEITGTYA
jgi:hypothetical protein